MSCGTSITLDTPFAHTVTRVREALKDQGVGVLTEIDMTATMREKLGEEIEDSLVLGACNPPPAYRALGVDRSIGLLSCPATSSPGPQTTTRSSRRSTRRSWSP